MPHWFRKRQRVHEQSNAQQSEPTSQDTDFIIAEFHVQRAEVLKRVELQHQLLVFTITALGGLLAVAIPARSAFILLLYPGLALFLAMAWAYNSRRVKEMQLYIALIESKGGFKDIGWERFRTSIQRGRFDSTTSSWEFAWGFFIGTQAVTWLVGTLAVAKVSPIPLGFNPEESVWVYVGTLLIVLFDLVFILFAWFILRPVKIKIKTKTGVRECDANNWNDICQMNDIYQPPSP